MTEVTSMINVALPSESKRLFHTAVPNAGSASTDR
jgi:hypothetical protein